MERLDSKGRKFRTGETFDKTKNQYRYTFKDTDGKRKSVYSDRLTPKDPRPKGSSEKSLRELEDEIAVKLSGKMNVSGGNITVIDLMERYIAIKSKDVRESTKAGYRTQLKFVKSQKFGKKKIADVSALDAETWFDDLHEKQGKNYSTLHTLRGVLRPAFAMAKKSRWVYENPFDFSLNKKRYGGQKTRDAISREDMRRFLDFVRTDKIYSKYFNGLYILFHTGLRISEFVGLTIDDIDFNSHVIHVTKQLKRLHDGKKMIYYIESPKTENGTRDVPMLGDVEDVFKQVIADRPKFKKEPEFFYQDDQTKGVQGFLWFDKDNNVEVAQHWQNHIRHAHARFNSIYKDELPPISAHVCRHTFCTNCVVAGMSPKVLQQIMGHSSIEFTLDVYTQIQIDDLQPIFDGLRQNANYNIYPIDRAPALVSNGADGDEPAPDLTEDEDDDDDDL